jgi:transposase-like protein
MALSKSALSDLLDALRAGGDLDVVREALALVLQALIDAEATQHIGARPYERTEQRTAHRNGTRARLLSTKAGDVELRIPKLREGSFFPALLEPRRRIDRALLAVVMEAYVHGTSTRKVDDLVKALGVDSAETRASGMLAHLPAPPTGVTGQRAGRTGVLGAREAAATEGLRGRTATAL